MGFKLGSERGNNFVSGEVKNKLRFSKEAGGDASLPGTPVIRKNLGTDIMGEANMDGSIYISKSITPGSFEERQVINHEMVHATQIRTGKSCSNFSSSWRLVETFLGKEMLIMVILNFLLNLQ